VLARVDSVSAVVYTWRASQSVVEPWSVVTSAPNHVPTSVLADLVRTGA